MNQKVVQKIVVYKNIIKYEDVVFIQGSKFQQTGEHLYEDFIILGGGTDYNQFLLTISLQMRYVF